MSVTLETFHFPIGWLNSLALENIPFISVTLDTSHRLMSSLKVVLPANNSSIFVTLETSQSLICPYCFSAASRFVHQRFTATLISSSVLVIFLLRDKGPNMISLKPGSVRLATGALMPFFIASLLIISKFLCILYCSSVAGFVAIYIYIYN